MAMAHVADWSVLKRALPLIRGDGAIATGVAGLSNSKCWRVEQRS